MCRKPVVLLDPHYVGEAVVLLCSCNFSTAGRPPLRKQKMTRSRRVFEAHLSFTGKHRLASSQVCKYAEKDSTSEDHGSLMHGDVKEHS
jgi:hypothetical protein